MEHFLQIVWNKLIISVNRATSFSFTFYLEAWILFSLNRNRNSYIALKFINLFPFYFSTFFSTLKLLN
jgi:hypothetical protein